MELSVPPDHGKEIFHSFRTSIEPTFHPLNDQLVDHETKEGEEDAANNDWERVVELRVNAAKIDENAEADDHEELVQYAYHHVAQFAVVD